LTTTISNSNLTVQINHFGAELFSLKNSENKEFIWEGNPAFWGKHSPILFPIVGTLKNNSFHYKKSEYHLSRHGFARDMEFELIEKSDESAAFSLISSIETKKMYPFDFELQICYSLVENKLNIDYKIINKNDFIMPFSIGAHPAFALPKPLEKYALLFEHNEILTSYELENDLLSDNFSTIKMIDNQVPLNYSLFEKDALIFKKLESKSITILENQNPLLRVRFDNFPNLGIWTKGNAPFLCIEPWFGYSDTVHSTGNILEKEGIQLLETKKSKECNFSVEIL
jgi:galactose mutarotase-like enzyme